MKATIQDLEEKVAHMDRALKSQKTKHENTLNDFAKEKKQVETMRSSIEQVELKWQNYERKLNSKREMLTTYSNKLKELEEEHMGCIERQMNDRKEIEALQRVVTVEIQKHLEKDTLARSLEREKLKSIETLKKLQVEY